MTTYENDYNEIINEDTIMYLHDIYKRSDTYKRKKDEDFNRRLHTQPKNIKHFALFECKDIYENISNKWKKERNDYYTKINTLIDINDRNIKGFIKKIGEHLRQNFTDIYELIYHCKFIYKNSPISNKKVLYERIFECVKYIFWVLQLTENELVDISFFDYTTQSLDGVHSLYWNLYRMICGNQTHHYINKLQWIFTKILKKYKDDNFVVCNYTMKDLNNLFDRVIIDNPNYEYNGYYTFSEDITKNDYTRINNIINTSENDYHHYYQKWVNHFGLNYKLLNLNGRLMVQHYYIQRLKDWGFIYHKRKYLSTNNTIPNDNGWCYYLNTNLIFINRKYNGYIQKIMNYNMEDYEKI
tara:strand:- start:4822 stop:5886 length:1065 start_codon:yes stop_codon:yes gene_type:complete